MKYKVGDVISFHHSLSGKVIQGKVIAVPGEKMYDDTCGEEWIRDFYMTVPLVKIPYVSGIAVYPKEIIE